MRKWLVFILFFGLILFPSPAGAEAEVKLDSLNIELLAEYDQSSMLVIHEFVVSRETPLPALVKLRFPKEGNLHAVAVKKDDGKLYDKDIATQAGQGSWQTITINVESYQPQHIEYYQPLKREGNKRTFTYQWFGDYYVKQFNVTLVVPADRTQLITSPALESTALSKNRLLLTGTITRNEMKFLQSFQFNVQYQRTSTTLTGPAEDTPLQPSEPVGENTAGRVSITNLPWIIAGFGLALIAIALFSYWRSTQVGEEKPKRRRRPQSESTTEPEPAEQAYCHECGTRAHPGDRFCRTCGSRLRIE